LAILFDCLGHKEDLVYLDGDPSTPIRMIDIAAGNAEVLRTMKFLTESTFAQAVLRRAETNSRGALTRTRRKRLHQRMNERVPSLIYENLVATDAAAGFVNKARKCGLRSFQADICNDVPDFLRRLHKRTGFMPNGVDRIILINVFDRLRDLQIPFEIFVNLAKADGKTDFLFGQCLPLKSHTDSMSHVGIPVIPCYDLGEDRMRREMSHEDKSEAICAFVKNLCSAGFAVDRMAEQHTEVYGPHCAVAEAHEFTTLFPKLENYDFVDPKLNAKRDRVFSGHPNEEDIIITSVSVGKTKEVKKLISFPQPYKLVLVAGKITKPRFDYAAGI
jgi:hypothetical protein